MPKPDSWRQGELSLPENYGKQGKENTLNEVTVEETPLPDDLPHEPTEKKTVESVPVSKADSSAALELPAKDVEWKTNKIQKNVNEETKKSAAQPPRPQIEHEKKKANKLIFVIPAVLVVAAIAGLLIFVLPKRGNMADSRQLARSIAGDVEETPAHSESADSAMSAPPQLSETAPTVPPTPAPTSELTDEIDESMPESSDNPTDSLLSPLSRVNYFDSNGNLIFFEDYAYYDNGCLCSITLYSVNYYSDSRYVGDEYTLLYLYDEAGNLTETILDVFMMGEWFDQDAGGVIITCRDSIDGNSRKEILYPKRENIDQEKFGVDTSRTKKLYSDISIISTNLSGEWAASYLRDIFDDEYPTDLTVCRFIYVDDDLIPELWIDYGYGYAGARVYTAKDGRTDWVYFGYSSPEWSERKNVLHTSGGHMDEYYDAIYKIEDGYFVPIAEGNFGAPDNSNVQVDESGEPIYDYYWNGTEVSKDEYELNLSNAFDTTQAADIYRNAYTYEQCKLLLRAIGNISAESVNQTFEPYLVSTSYPITIFEGPGFSFSTVGLIEEPGVYTIVEERWDAQMNIWGKLKSGLGWINLSEVQPYHS